MVLLRYFGPLLLVLSLTARPGQAQKADLTPMRPLPQVPTAPGEMMRRPTPPLPAQAPAPTAPATQQPGPLVLLNSRLIVGLGGLSELNPKNIEKIILYKGGDYPGTSTPAQWRSLDANGIIDVTLKKKLRLKSQSLAQLSRYLQAKGPVSYTLNGLPAPSGTLRIATETIEEIKVVRTLAGTTLSVRVYAIGHQPAKAYPPGTILIRGTASR